LREALFVITADAMFAHDLLRLQKIVAGTACEQLARHAARRVQTMEVGAPRLGGHAYVAISDHPEHPSSAIDHRDAAAVVLPHDLRSSIQHVARAASHHLTDHQFLDLHVSKSPSSRSGFLIELSRISILKT